MSSPLSEPSSPLSPVDAEDLAQSLDSLLEVIPKNCMGELCQRSTRSEQLIARYRAQQSAKAQECTGFAASWCPRCGDCTCDRFPSGERINECAPGNTCPLHGFTSTHAEPQQTEASKPALSDGDVRLQRDILVGLLDQIIRSHASDSVDIGFEIPLGAAIENAYNFLIALEEQKKSESKPALSEVERAAVNVVNAHDVVVRISHRTVRGIEASVECDKTIEALRDALKRIGAL